MPSRTDRRDATILAAAASNMKIDFIEGITGDQIPEVALPPGNKAESLKLFKGIRGSWRSHMNALQAIVHQNLSSAMIFEDDVDWDVRLRPQLQDLAFASQFLTSGPQDLSRYPVQTIPNPEAPEVSIHNESSENPIPSTLHSLPLSKVLGPSLKLHPYGDPANWDVLWLGHCGAGFPRPPRSGSGASDKNILLTNPNDPTVPLPKYLRAHPFGPLDALGTSHPPHTRVYHRGSGGALCTVAYAVSQRGARRLLHEFGVSKWGRIWDVELGDWCAGSDSPAGSKPEDGSEALGEARMDQEDKGERKCITVQPPIFAHHHPLGGESDIGGLGGGYARTVETKYLRLSVRMNLQAMVRGDGPEVMVDQWPD
ncbi:Uncharacterized protein BP5553_02323 [Venustampulla echinocandica]|uniref:Glycosyl transferase family 25 domain-containing protein n=1 Tax=Venustampulla echinocandica TaxID=2656787 RepID=A0A370U3K6_9HELO|nr:Uncharacterized protein BP5553_02323 [Venustampulla echinocandica]RDL42344.1 Uncharacterized protein BP5553_02323 [Venustampulla echinocandica]